MGRRNQNRPPSKPVIDYGAVKKLVDEAMDLFKSKKITSDRDDIVLSISNFFHDRSYITKRQQNVLDVWVEAERSRRAYTGESVPAGRGSIISHIIVAPPLEDDDGWY